MPRRVGQLVQHERRPKEAFAKLLSTANISVLERELQEEASAQAWLEGTFVYACVVVALDAKFR